MRRLSRLAALGAAVLGLHALLLAWFGERLQMSAPSEPAIERLSAVYTREIVQSLPPVAAAAAPRPAARPQAAPAAPAPPPDRPEAPASAPLLADAAEISVSAEPPPASAGPQPPDFDPQAAPGSVAAAPPEIAVAASAPAAAPAAASGPAFEWPVSTRLRYTLTGWYQGEVHGEAQVEWLRSGERYQVHLEVSVGPSLAPLMSRRMSSEGRITPEGLRPQRYEQETRQIVGRDRRVLMSLDGEGVQLADGRRMPARADVQDSASQFIQMVWLFSTRPALRQPGERVEFDLALPHRVRRWVYEVGARVPMNTPLGVLETLHVRPVPITTALPEAAAEAVRQGGSLLSAQIWYAPMLQMLPVRIRIEQDASTWLDLRLSEVPQQAGSPAATK
ncbi:MAG: hypothetical protein RL654_994 [Pseudomonadota bacterium]|jgi:hypothetical protein